MDGDRKSDFFISHTASDGAWARWIAQTLEANGYSTLIMDWDFLPGQNFVVRMQQAAMDGTRVLAIVSPDYMDSAFGSPEWAAAFADDPKGSQRRLIPILVRETERTGLLNQLVPINLIGKSQEQAAEELLKGVGSGERRKPDGPVPFPGPASSTSDPEPAEPAPPATTAEEWAPLETAIELEVRPLERTGFTTSRGNNVVLELYLAPVPPARLRMTELRDLPDELAARGRAAKFFAGSEALSSSVREETAIAEAQADRDTTTRGISLSRAGQVAIWEGLPQDSMGAVIDAADVRNRLARLLVIASAMPDQPAPRYAIAARIVAHGIYIFGSSGDVGSRSSASGLEMDDRVFEAAPEDSVSMDYIMAEATAVADEITARLEASWRRPRDSFQ